MDVPVRPMPQQREETKELQLSPDMAKFMGEFADQGLLNLAGGCCGNTPDHIEAIAKALEGKAPREVPSYDELKRGDAEVAK